MRRGKGGRRREVGMDERAWEQLQAWIDVRLELDPKRVRHSVVMARPARRSARS